MKRRLSVGLLAVILGLLAGLQPWASAIVGPDEWVFYGGGSDPTGRHSGRSLGLSRHGDMVYGWLSAGVVCKHTVYTERAMGLRGSLSGAAFTLAGRLKLDRYWTVTARVVGSLTDDSGTGQLTYRLRRGKAGGPRGCRTDPKPAAVHVKREYYPMGPPQRPAPGAIFRGVIGQMTREAPVRLPATVRVTQDGKRAYAAWLAEIECLNTYFPVDNYSPAAPIRPDNTFRRNERFTIRYGPGSSDSYRVTFGGRFYADGVRGTFRARIVLREHHRVIGRCDTGTGQFWIGSG